VRGNLEDATIDGTLAILALMIGGAVIFLARMLLP
jgi:hypothetical protein